MAVQRVVLCGAGVMGRVHADAYGRNRHAVVVAVVDPLTPGQDLAASLGTPWFADLGAALAECPCDIVDVCVPTFLHEAYVVAALEAGRAVLCEKPMALTVASAVRISAAAARTGRQLMIAQTLRFWPEYVAIAEAWRSGRLGEQVMASAVRLRQMPTWSPWYADPSLSGGGALEVHVHDIDYLVGLFGRVRELRAVGWKNARGAWNHVVTTLSFVSGERAVAEGCVEITPGFPSTDGFRLVGTHESMELAQDSGPAPDGVPQRQLRRYVPGAPPETVRVAQEDAYVREIDYFVDCVARGIPCAVVPIAESVHVLRVMDAIRESLDTGDAQAPEGRVSSSHPHVSPSGRPSERLQPSGSASRGSHP